MLQGESEGEGVVVDDLRPAAVVAPGCGRVLALQGLFADVVAVESSWAATALALRP
ncbi:hypothetical protein ACFQ0B_49835 [Nonomuraea thailandensis]